MTRRGCAYAWPLTWIAVLCTAAYARALDRYFVSEDFTILARLAEGPFLQTTWEQFTGPWLGITFVRFFRPVSTLVLQLELLAFGATPTPYLVTHLLVHLLNTVLVYCLARRLLPSSSGKEGGAGAVALLFALYPLHPNAVIFIGSFATLFMATACLAAVLFFLRYRELARRRDLGLALACFALGLGCYEAAAVVPAILITVDLITDAKRPAWHRFALRHAPFIGLAVCYLAWRQMVLGAAVGGYRGFEALITGAQLHGLLVNAWLDWSRFVIPVYSEARPGWLPWLGSAVIALLTLVLFLRRRQALALYPLGGIKGGTLWLLGLAWIVIWQAPFNIWSAVPGNGRYWYLSSAGLGLLVAAAAELLPAARRRAALFTLTGLLGSIYFGLLYKNAGLHAEAGQKARTLQQAVLERAGSSERLFLHGRPTFVHDAGAPAAQVFHWGLTDAFRPPFVKDEVVVYPLPGFGARRLLPILRRPDLGASWRVDGDALELMAPPPDPGVGHIAVETEASWDNGFLVRFRSMGDVSYRTVVIARGQPAFPEVRATSLPDGLVEAPLPARFIQSMDRLYGDEIFWWIEARDDAKLIASSDLFVLPPCPAGLRMC